jgi:hypothetical protein
VTNWYPCPDHSLFKGKTASKKKCNKILSPEFFHACWRCFELPFYINIIAWSIGSYIRPVSKEAWLVFARFKNFKKRTRLWISLTEKKKIKGMLLGKDDEVCLGVTQGNTCSWFIPISLTDYFPDLCRF